MRNTELAPSPRAADCTTAAMMLQRKHSPKLGRYVTGWQKAAYTRDQPPEHQRDSIIEQLNIIAVVLVIEHREDVPAMNACTQ